ncbi:MAG: hypothetical protein CL694_15465 [Chloroflexi bacterium]|nr:hypothetical protein [Chloroflexota bacterium]
MCPLTPESDHFNHPSNHYIEGCPPPDAERHWARARPATELFGIEGAIGVPVSVGITMAWWSLAAAKRRRAVVSLIELLIVLVIIGVLAGVVVPRVAGDGGVVSVAAVDEVAVSVQR